MKTPIRPMQGSKTSVLGQQFNCCPNITIFYVVIIVINLKLTLPWMGDFNAYCTVSRRIIVDALNILLPFPNIDVGSQLTFPKGTVTLTVTDCPYVAVLGSDGTVVIVAPVIPAEVR